MAPLTRTFYATRHDGSVAASMKTAAGITDVHGRERTPLSPLSCLRRRTRHGATRDAAAATPQFHADRPVSALPLKYKFTYVDRLTPEFVPAALAFGSGIHGAAAARRPHWRRCRATSRATGTLRPNTRRSGSGRGTRRRACSTSPAGCWRCSTGARSLRPRSWGSSSRSTCR
jgi:hypothetical protein